MAGLSHLSVHDVRSIELTSSMPDNQNSRTLTITTRDGVMEITVYGKTDALDALPRSFDFRCSINPGFSFEPELMAAE